MKFIDLLYDILLEDIRSHYTLRKGRLQDEVYVVLDLGEFSPIHSGKEAAIDYKDTGKYKFSRLMRAMGIGKEQSELYVDLLKNKTYKTIELPTAINVGNYTLPAGELDKVYEKLSKIENNYVDYYNHVVSETPSKTDTVVLVVHQYQNFGDNKILEVIKNNFVSDEVKEFTEKVLNFVSKKENENKFLDIKLSNSLVDTVKVYLRNKPLPNDIKGSIGEAVYVIMKKENNRVDLVTLLNDRSSRIYNEYISLGAVLKPWDDYERFVKSKETPKTNNQPKTNEDKIKPFKKLGGLVKGSLGQEILNVAKEYYRMNDELISKDSESERKKVYDNLKIIKDRLSSLLVSTAGKPGVDTNKDIIPLKRTLETDIKNFFDLVYQ